MRISDWSSDVCSSDLIANLGIALHRVDEEYAVIEALPEEAARVLVGLCGMRPESWIKVGIGEQQIADMVAIARVTGQAIELTALEDDAVIALMLFVGEAATRILGPGPVDAKPEQRRGGKEGGSKGK